jgi:hypothetical protein
MRKALNARTAYVIECPPYPAWKANLVRYRRFHLAAEVDFPFTFELLWIFTTYNGSKCFAFLRKAPPRI